MITERKMIDKNKLVRIFKMFKNEPNKVFLAADFIIRRKGVLREKYLNTLIFLGLIKRVPAVYKCGNKLLATRRVKGYKLKMIKIKEVIKGGHK